MDMENEKTDEMPMSRVILMSCGRYNPPTHMHLRMFERARDHLHTLRIHRVVGGVISPVNDYCKEDDLANSSTRLDLLKLALQTNNWVHLSTWEIRQKTYKSIRETLRFHQNVLNSIVCRDVDNNVNNEDTEWIRDDIKSGSNQLPVKIKLLCGSDLLESFLKPGKWSENDIVDIVSQYGLVVIGKEGSNPKKFIYDSDILSKYEYNIHVVTEWIPNEVNASRIRTALRRGESVKYLLQNSVIEYIHAKNIYSAKMHSPEGHTGTRMSSDKSGATTLTGSGATGGRVVLMSCGSYNPPTHMHFRMFERARDHLHNHGGHVVVGGVISPVNDAYGKKDLASGAHRVEMLKLALRDSDWIRLSTWEIRQTSWTRTLASLRHHQDLLDSIAQDREDANSNIDNEDLDWVPGSLRSPELDNCGRVRIKLLCGGDLLESFATPGLWLEEDITEIVGQYGLIVITREGSNPYKFIYDSDVLSKHSHNIQVVTEWIPNEVSSTRIRRALKRGESVKYLLQDAVIEYVYENGIYGADRPSAIKLNLSSIHSSTDYLDTDEAKSYQHPHHDPDNALLTPSPSDVTMLEANPCLADSPAPTPIDDDDDNSLPDSVLRNNLQNSASTDLSSPSPSPDDTELAREKFFRSIVNDSLSLAESPSSSLLLLQSDLIFGQIDSPGEPTPCSSARARNELLAFEEATGSELATITCDNNTYSDDREEDVLSVTYEEGSESDLNESSVRNNRDWAEDTASSIRDGDPVPESLSYDRSPPDSQATCRLEIDGKYRKSLVNSIKNGRREDEPPEPKRDVKFEDDLTYLKKLRLVVNKEQPDVKQQRQLQGSLDSINLRERDAEGMAKKSKSCESIKRQSGPDEFCSACCLGATPTSDCSSPEEDECDICSSLDLREEEEEESRVGSEICEICGEPAASTPEPPDDDGPRGSRPFGLPKAKSTMEIGRIARAGDDRFEIDNCGLRECRLRASLDVCNKPEPLYVNVAPRCRPSRSRADPTQQPYYCYYYYGSGGSGYHQDGRSVAQRDEVGMSRSLSVGGSKRLSRRGGSYAKKTPGDRTQEKRRFSSADNLQNRASFKCGPDKFSKTRDNKFMTSADSIRVPRVARSRSLRRSADNVGRFDASGDNLDSLEETVDGDEIGAGEVEAGRSRLKDSDTIKMILTKHGIKVISQKETVL